ncbi:hypothetical protein [Nesterenkonia cremea]|uniref:Uncharacterized protein n=1 Tax=Nesterenkonia cremea TaxID=1882340 RepID=A0A917ERU4_9MICC|nr:hypothetical protein [Nesterenkonia cremea]GGE71362.1 hypothetical protein GCM10011401_18050 [Nesterenkonia cremea]
MTSTSAPASPMPKLTLGVGGLLIAVGVIGYLVSMINDTQHFTALIPSFLGVLLLISGFIALKNTKLGVHLGLALALLGALAMGMPLSGLGDLFAGEAERPAAVISALVTVIVLVVYIALGVRSFIAARRWKG